MRVWAFEHRTDRDENGASRRVDLAAGVTGVAGKGREKIDGGVRTTRRAVGQWEFIHHMNEPRVLRAHLGPFFPAL